jgi:AcrR family transcriptional regulator
MPASATVNFRTRTGHARRIRTRTKILTAAFALFDERGVNRVTVEDVREAAGLARGTFYNYFLTYEDMLKELAARIARQVNIEQSERFDAVTDMSERLWSNVRYGILRTASDRSCSQIIVRIMPLMGPLNEAMRQHAERNLRLAIKRKVINLPSASVALDFGYGLASVMIRRALTGRIRSGELESAGLMLLRAYGIPEREARRISRLRFAPLPPRPLRDAVIRDLE